jgi:hypothetical protein
MAEQDSNILSASKQLYAATVVANVSPRDKAKVDGFAAIVNKNRELLSIPEADARKQFLQLDEGLQQTLKKFNPDAAWAKEQDLSLFGKFKENIVAPALDNLAKYSSRLSEPYRAIRTSVVEDIPLSEAWKMAYDGNALFDKQREQKVDNYYEAPVAKIAKQISTGKTIGEVLATLNAPEEIEAMRKMLEGDVIFAQAIKDYDTAKISLGRDLFYEAFDIDAGEFGANRFAFNRLSGAADLATQIFFDPITYIPIAGQAYKASQLSILKIASATGDSALANAFNPNTFFGKGVVNFFDEIGADIKKLDETKDKAQRAEIIAGIKNKFEGDISDEGIIQLASNKVFNADDAKLFLSDVDNATAMLNGRWTGPTPVLPTYGKIKEFKNGIRTAVSNATGSSKVVKTGDIDLEKVDIYSLFDEAIAANQAGNVEEAARIAKLVNDASTAFGRFSKFWAISPRLKNLAIGYKLTGDGKRIDEGLKSTKDIVALARVANFPKPIADRIGAMWIEADPAQRIKMRDGIVAVMAHTMGLSLTSTGRSVLNRTINTLNDELYAIAQKANPAYLDNYGAYGASVREFSNLTDEVLEQSDELQIDPSKFGGANGRAVAEWQLTDTISIPPIQEWYKEAYKTKNLFIQSMGPLFNNKISSGLVDAWAFLTLIPRLGFRSIIEEVMLFGFVAPTQAIKSLFTEGFKTSRAMRRITGAQKAAKGIKSGVFDPDQNGMLVRAWYAISQKNVNEELLNAVKAGKPKQELMAIAMAASTKPLKGIGKKQHIQDAEDFVTYSLGSKLYEDIALAASQGVRTQMLAPKGVGSPEQIARLYGEVQEYSINLARALEGNAPSGPIQPIFAASKSNAYYMNWLINVIKQVEMNGQLGKISIRYMDEPDKAIAMMIEYLDNNPNLVQQFVNSYDGAVVDTTQLAIAIFGKSLENFIDASGKLNPRLLDLVRKKVKKADGTDDIVLDADVDMDILKSFKQEELPETIMGRQFIPVAKNQEDAISKIQKWGYGWMDRQIATLAREPLFASNFYYYRKQLRGIETKKFEQLKKLGYSDEAAQEIAREFASNSATELATRRTLEFVDNPNMRTNFAWSIRNFARFYRATEDFYRRLYRATIKNPQSIVRLRLTSDALDHTGFIHNDDNGDKYFIFPTDEILTAAISPITTLLTGKTLQTPMPLEFTGKIKMITPSLDPESSIPTLSGPLSGISMMTLQKLMPNFMGPVKDGILGVTLGPRSRNARWTDVIMPSNVRRVVDALNQDERDSQFASAARKAIVYMAANGQSLPLDATEAQKLEYRQQIEGIAANIVVTRFFLGLLSPVAPQVGFGRDIPDYLKDAGNVNFKAEFNKLVNDVVATGEPDAYNIALQKWTKLNPGLLAYTIGETDANRIATVKKTDMAARWVKDNRNLINKYPEGSGFFIPYTGEFNFDDYTFLKREGYTESVPVEEFLKRVTIADEKTAYYELKKSYDDKLENTANPAMKSAIRDEWSAVKKDFLIDKPLLVQDMETRQSRQQIVNSLNDLRSMISSGDAPKNNLTAKYKQMIETYDKAQSSLNLLTSNTKVQRLQKELIRQNAYNKIQEIAAGDPQAEMAIRVLFNELLGV